MTPLVADAAVGDEVLVDPDVCWTDVCTDIVV